MQSSMGCMHCTVSSTNTIACKAQQQGIHQMQQHGVYIAHSTQEPTPCDAQQKKSEIPSSMGAMCLMSCTWAPRAACYAHGHQLTCATHEAQALHASYDAHQHGCKAVKCGHSSAQSKYLVLTPAFVEHHIHDNAWEALVVVDHALKLQLELLLLCDQAPVPSAHSAADQVKTM